MYLIKITATATERNHLHHGEVKTWYQGQRMRWDENPQALKAWATEKGALCILDKTQRLFPVDEHMFAMWVHSLQIVQIP